MSSSSGLSRNKMTSLSTALKTSANNSSSKKLRSELRRVMSDRVMKITRCSQQQNVEKIKQRLTTNNSSDSSILPVCTNTPKFSTNETFDPTSKEKLKNKSPLISNENATTVAKTTSPNLSNTTYTELVKQYACKDLSPRNLLNINSKVSPKLKSLSATNKISLLPIKTFDLKDRNSLVEHIRNAYNEVVDANGSIVLSVQSIINSIIHYSDANNLDLKKIVGEILKETLFQSNIQLKQKYKDKNEQSDKLKIEGQLQVLLQIENYIIINSSSGASVSGKIKVDDDWVWEIANTIRWLKQNLKDFKIEKFLFGEIYANYFLNASEFILSLMEELGYDKDDNAASSTGTDSSSPTTSPSKRSYYSSQQQLNESKSSSIQQQQQVNTSIVINQTLNSLKEESNSNCSFSFTGGVNSLFEDESANNEQEHEYDYEHSQSNLLNNEDSTDPLVDLKRKTNKTATRFSDFSQSSIRSIVVQRKRMRLKIRSPYKSPSKNFTSKLLVETTTTRRSSPRVKDKQILTSDTTNINSQKRPRTYLITDTPDHKQNATIITTRQEKLRKRFSFQQFNQLPVVPDTPVKNKSEDSRLTGTEQQTSSTEIIALTASQKLYSSPKKKFYL